MRSLASSQDSTVPMATSDTGPFRPAGQSLMRDLPSAGPTRKLRPVQVVGPNGVLSADDLLTGIRNGDRDTFNAICNAYHDPLWRFAFTLIQVREVAQDAVQDVFLNLWDRRQHVLIPTSLGAYLFSAVRNRSLMLLRNNRTAARISSTWGIEKDTDTHYCLPGHGQRPPSPSDAAETGDLTFYINRAVEKLSPVRRQIIMMRWIEQLQYDEIADIMAMSPEAVRAHVSRAYRTLRDLLRSFGIDSPDFL